MCSPILIILDFIGILQSDLFTARKVRKTMIFGIFSHFFTKIPAFPAEPKFFRKKRPCYFSYNFHPEHPWKFQNDPMNGFRVNALRTDGRRHGRTDRFFENRCYFQRICNRAVIRSLCKIAIKSKIINIGLYIFFYEYNFANRSRKSIYILYISSHISPGGGE